MDTKIKINLGAIMKDQELGEQSNAPPPTLNNQDSTNKGEDEKKGKEINIVNLMDEDNTTSLKKSGKGEKNSGVDNSIFKKKSGEKDSGINKNTISSEKKIGKDENKEGKKSIVSFNEIEKNIKENEKEKETNKTKKINIGEKQPKNEEPKDLFQNYESTFTKQKEQIIKKINKLKNLPKTRPIFLSTIIIIAISGIGLLFYIDPKNHSLSNYKSSIINIIDKNDIINNTQTTDGNTLTPTIVYEKERIQVGGINFEVEIGIVNNKTILKYNGNIYNSKEELINDLSTEVEDIKKERLINELKKFF